MEQLNPNWGALPGTVLESGPGPIEVGLARQEQEATMAIEQDKLRLQQKQAADKARKEKTGTDFTPVMAEHYDEYATLIDEFNNETALAIQAKERNPLNRDMDIDNPSSPAARALKKKEDLIKQQAHVSEFLEKAYAEDLKRFEAGEMTAEDLAERKRYYSAPLKDHMAGKMVPPPVLGFYEYQTEYNKMISGLQTDKTAYAAPNEKGYVFAGSKEFISPARLEQSARNMAANPNSLHFEFKRRQLARLKEVDPQAFKEIERESDKYRMSPEQFSTWEDLKAMASIKETKSVGTDQTYNNMKGTGWGDDQAAADRLIRWMSGVTNNDPEVITEVFGEITPVAGGQQPITMNTNSGFARAIEGVVVAKKKDWTGKEVVERVKGVAINNGKVFVQTVGEDGSAGRILEYNQEDFISDFVEQVADNNPLVKRGPLYEAAKELGRIRESGRIDPIEKPRTGAADLILAPTKKGMMD